MEFYDEWRAVCKINIIEFRIILMNIIFLYIKKYLSLKYKPGDSNFTEIEGNMACASIFGPGSTTKKLTLGQPCPVKQFWLD